MRKQIACVLLLVIFASLTANGRANSAQNIIVKITKKGYEPKVITVKKDVPTKITFIRQTNQTCGTEIVIPDYKIEKSLPLNKAVRVEITPKNDGELTFTCGMNMLRGKIIVQ